MKPTLPLPAFPTIAIETTPWADAWRLRQDAYEGVARFKLLTLARKLVVPLLNERPRQLKVVSLLNEGGLAQIPTDLQGFGVRFGVEWSSNMVTAKGTATS
jgi:hypothetical protein